MPEVLGVDDEAVDVVGGDREVEHQPLVELAPQLGAAHRVVDVERDEALHLLGERQVGRIRWCGRSDARGSGLLGQRDDVVVRRRRRTRPRTAVIRSQARSAKAAMVSDGFAPTGPGITEPSRTYRPGKPNTSPMSSQTPSATCRPIGAPPSGWTVTTRRRPPQRVVLERRARGRRRWPASCARTRPK